MRRVLKFLAPYWWQILLVIAFTYGEVWTTLELPSVMSDIVNKGIITGDMDYIYQRGWFMVIITALGSLSAIIAGFFASRVGTGFGRDLRAGVYKKVEGFGLAEMRRFSTSSLITRSTNDVEQIQQVAFFIMRIAVRAPLMAIGAILSAFRTAPSMTWIMVLSVITLLVLVISVFMIAMPKFQLQQKLVDALNQVSRENLTGLRVIRAFNNEKIEKQKFNEVNRDITKTGLFINRITNILEPGMTMIISFTTLAVVWIGAGMVMDDKLEIGNMMAFMQYSLQVITSFLMLVIIMVMVPRAHVSVERISEILETDNSVREPKNPQKPDESKRGLVEFKHVTFTYPDAESPVLNDIDFVTKPGETTAIIGSTGSGKSTVANLISRLYDVTAGQVRLDGVDLRSLSHRDIAKIVGFVPQKAVLFSGTIASNIKYARADITDEAMRRAADIAQADFVKDLPDGYRAHVARSGSNFSGGQKQRLAIARAIAKDPEVLVFDDSFSALDYRTDARLRSELAKRESDKTIIIITQRISTIREANQIIVLNDGGVAGKGTHYELLKSCEVYREIAESQFSEEEMAGELKLAGVSADNASDASNTGEVKYA